MIVAGVGLLASLRQEVGASPPKSCHGAEVWLVGATHVAEASAAEVAELISARPDQVSFPWRFPWPGELPLELPLALMLVACCVRRPPGPGSRRALPQPVCATRVAVGSAIPPVFLMPQVKRDALGRRIKRATSQSFGH